jgi:microcystin-dependent protein
MKPYAGGFVPPGWTLADNRVVNIADFPRLYAAVGQKWTNAGDVFDPLVQFRVPDGTRPISGGTPDVFHGALLNTVVVNTLGATVTAGVKISAVMAAGSAQALYRSTVSRNSGQWFLRSKANTGDATQSQGYILGVTDATFAHYVQAELRVVGGATSLVVADNAGHTVTLPLADLVDGDEFILYGDADAKTLGVVAPDGTDNPGLEATIPYPVDGGGNARVLYAGGGLASALAPAVPFSNTVGLNGQSGAIAAPVGYPGFSYTVTGTVGTRSGSNTTAGTVLTVAQLAAHHHDVGSLHGGNGGVGGGGSFYPNVDGPPTSVTGDTGGDEAHDHDFTPPVSAVLMLVKI